MVPVGRVRGCPSPFFSLAVAGMDGASRVRSCGAAAPPLRPVCFFWCGGRADAPPSRRAIESPASRPPDGRARLRAGLAGDRPACVSRRRPCIGSGGRWRRRFVLSVEVPAPFRWCSGQRRAGRGRVPPVVADGRRPLSRPTADVPARRAPSPPGAGGAGVFRPLRRAGKDGKDSVKGNRQGSLSRSITRRSDQNRKIKYCFYFAILPQLVKKVRSDFFDKLKISPVAERQAIFFAHFTKSSCFRKRFRLYCPYSHRRAALHFMPPSGKR